jgi:serine/threonine-protein kinase ATR
MMQKDLQDISFSAWQTLLTNLDDEDIELMLESTFSIISQFWNDFEDVTRQRVKSVLLYLLDSRALLIKNAVFNLPSLSQFPQLADIEERLRNLRTPIDEENSFQIFCRRVSHENPGVVAQALVELKAYLHNHQSFLQSSAVSEQPDVVIGLLVRSVLDACVKFNESRLDIALLSAEVLGLIGCLDPNRVESVRERREMVVVSNFIDPGETTDFVLFMLEEVIVKAFLSSTDTGVQGFLSYVMQVLLEKCDFREVCVPILQNDQRGRNHPIWLKWKSLPDSVQDTLTPFLTSRYVVKELAEINIEYPIFKPGSMRSDRLYNTWLKDFVMDLLQKPQNIHAQLIFAPLRRAIKIRDNSAASFLLPYLVLHVILAGTDQNREQIGAELLLILQYKVTSESHIKLEDLKMCSEVRTEYTYLRVKSKF